MYGNPIRAVYNILDKKSNSISCCALSKSKKIAVAKIVYCGAQKQFCKFFSNQTWIMSTLPNNNISLVTETRPPGIIPHKTSHHYRKGPGKKQHWQLLLKSLAWMFLCLAGWKSFLSQKGEQRTALKARVGGNGVCDVFCTRKPWVTASGHHWLRGAPRCGRIMVMWCQIGLHIL